ncbi:MAG: serine/threonine protein kinase [Deltaproteobacteria bacterium]|nr:serine/threonine protein kinase [Deltaproteobacteria bacterium]
MAGVDERARRDAETDRLQLRRASLIAAGAFIGLSGIDVVITQTLHPEVPLVSCLAWRLVGAIVVGLGWVLFARPRSIRWHTVVASTLLALSVVPLAMNTAAFGGLGSPYVFHLAFYAVGISSYLPSDWRRLTTFLGSAFAVYIGTLLVALELSPVGLVELADTREVATFTVNMLLVAGMIVFAIVTGDARWRAQRQLEQARNFGRYRLKSPLGEGGMNEVWLAWDGQLRRDVALKLLRGARPDDPRFERFEREARATSQLKSGNTVRIFDYGATDDGVAWIAMEHLRGADLDRLVATHGALDARRVVHLARQAAASLAEAHAAGLVHRDIKPANLFVLSAPGEEDVLKVVDFGIVRQVGKDERGLTLVGTVIGTPAIMAPEQILGQPADARSDVYSLGATLYCALTGRLPIDAKTPHEFFAAHAHITIPRPSTHLPTPLPEGLDALIMACLSQDPTQRPADGAQLFARLDALGLAPWTQAEARAWWEAARIAAAEVLGTMTIERAAREPRDTVTTETPAAAA